MLGPCEGLPLPPQEISKMHSPELATSNRRCSQALWQPLRNSMRSIPMHHPVATGLVRLHAALHPARETQRIFAALAYTTPDTKLHSPDLSNVSNPFALMPNKRSTNKNSRQKTRSATRLKRHEREQQLLDAALTLF